MSPDVTLHLCLTGLGLTAASPGALIEATAGAGPGPFVRLLVLGEGQVRQGGRGGGPGRAGRGGGAAAARGEVAGRVRPLVSRRHREVHQDHGGRALLQVLLVRLEEPRAEAGAVAAVNLGPAVAGPSFPGAARGEAEGDLDTAAARAGLETLALRPLPSLGFPPLLLSVLLSLPVQEVTHAVESPPGADLRLAGPLLGQLALLHDVEIRQQTEVGVGVDQAGRLARLHQPDVLQLLDDWSDIFHVHVDTILTQ